MAADSAIYFESGWAIISTIGVANILYGFMVIGIIGFRRIILVPIVVAVAGAIANGLCYYVFYTNYDLTGRLVASAFADILWMVQQAGLSLYGYVILVQILDSRTRVMFQASYWTEMLIVFALRLGILVYRIRVLLNPSQSLICLITRLHVGYFVSIAIVECTSASLLLWRFRAAVRTATDAQLSGGFFKYMMRSTEIRVSLLCLIGISRAVAYSFRVSEVVAATSAAAQIDRFTATLELCFPMVLYIDLLASRLKFAHDTEANASTSNIPIPFLDKYAVSILDHDEESEHPYTGSDADYYHELKDDCTDRKMELRDEKKRQQQERNLAREIKSRKEWDVYAAFEAMLEAQKDGECPRRLESLAGKTFYLYSEQHVDCCYDDSLYPSKYVEFYYINQDGEPPSNYRWPAEDTIESSRVGT